MLENQGNNLVFLSHYIKDGAAVTGLAVTIDIYEITRDGTTTQPVNDGACTEVGNGLYKYVLAAASVDAAAEYVAVFHTAGDVDQADIPALWCIGRAGVPNLDAPISTVDADVWGYGTRTLTQTAAQVASVMAGSTITCQRGDSLNVSLTGLGNISARTKSWLTVKVDTGLPDSAATLFNEETAGLTIVNGAAYTPVTDGVISVTDALAGNLDWDIAAVVTAVLPIGSYYYDYQTLDAGGVHTRTAGILTVTADVTRAVS